MKKKVALIAGGAGFLGSHIAERLISENWKVRLVDLPSAPFSENLAGIAGNPNLSVEQTDIMAFTADHNLYEGVDEYFQCINDGHHLESTITPEPFFSPNLLPTIRILEAARRNPGARVHFVSSAAVYGNVAGEINEEAPWETNTIYGLVKAYQEQALAFWHRMYQTPNIIYRPFACYGPRSSSGVFGVFLARIKEGKPLTVTGNGETARDFVYVDDVVDAFVLACNSKIENGVYNIGTGQLTTIKKLATLMGGEIEYIEAREVDESSFASIKRIKNDLGWQPEISIDEGVAAAMETLEKG